MPLPNTVSYDWVRASSFHVDLCSPFGVLDQTMPDVGPGAGLYFYVFRVFEPPISEVPTYKRVKYVVDSASGATTEFQAADGVSQALSALPDGPDTCTDGQEWKLLDGEVKGLCDDQAVLMKRCLNLIGVPASAYKLHACTTWPGLYTPTSRAYTGPPLPNPRWRKPTEFLAFRHDGDSLELWEGVCRAADETWPTFPLHHEDTDQLFYLWLRDTANWKQYWWREPVFHMDTGAIVVPASWLEGPIAGPN